MSKLAPIGISTYCRLQHLMKTVDALKNNTLAPESDLYFFSDAPQSGDEHKVAKLREYLNQVEGFKSVTVFERQSNGRVENNRGGIRQLLDDYGHVIFMEEDVVTAPGFLEFVNGGLEFYKDDNRILSVGGFSPQGHNISTDLYFSPKFMGWGFGIWKKEFELIKYQPPFKEILKDVTTCERLREMGDDMLHMTRQDAIGKIDALDVKACYIAAKLDMLNVLPAHSLVKNIGLDGTGLHCGDVDIYAPLEVSDKTRFEYISSELFDSRENRRCVASNKAVFSMPSLTSRAINKVSRLIVGKKLIK